MDQFGTTHLLLLVAALQIKHFIADGPLQTRAMVDAKAHYGRLQGVLHALIHAAGTLIVLLAFGFGAATAAGLALLDLAIHYHVDYIKENVTRRAGWTPADGPFWWALSADQTAHQLTYLVIAYLAVTP